MGFGFVHPGGGAKASLWDRPHVKGLSPCAVGELTRPAKVGGKGNQCPVLTLLVLGRCLTPNLLATDILFSGPACFLPN